MNLPFFAYVQNRYRLTLRARVATALRNAWHRCYGPGWEGRMTAMRSEPAWLRAFWRWCGVRFIMPVKIITPRISSCYKRRVVQDPDGSWWCETTFTPPPYFDIREIIMADVVRTMGVPEGMFLKE